MNIVGNTVFKLCDLFGNERFHKRNNRFAVCKRIACLGEFINFVVLYTVGKGKTAAATACARGKTVYPIEFNTVFRFGNIYGNVFGVVGVEKTCGVIEIRIEGFAEFIVKLVLG